MLSFERDTSTGPRAVLLRLSLRAKVLSAILLAVLPLAGAVVFFSFYVRADESADTRLTSHRKLRVTAARVLDLAIDAETGVRGFLVTGRTSFLEPYVAAEELLPEQLSQLGRFADVDQRADIIQIDDLIATEMAILEGIADRPDDVEVQTALRRGKAVMDRLRDATARVIQTTEQEMDAIIADRDATRTTAYRALILGGGVGALSSLWAGAVLVGGVVRRVQRNTENARLLAEGGELFPPEDGGDELAEQSRRMHETALLLRARESALRQAREEAEMANRAKSEFLSRMSHELRTPLNAVIGFAQVLRQEVGGEASEDVGEILRAGKHLLALIDEVLDLSRIESGMINMSVEPVSVREILDESIALVRGAARERSIQIRVEDGQDDLNVLADRQRFKQVVLNLLSNAIKYNRDAGSVDVTVTRSEGTVRIAVSDQGLGIPGGAQGDLFTPFSRLGAEQTPIEGTGLGLALSKHLVEAMGGDIGFQSDLGVGSTFWIELGFTSQDQAEQVPQASVDELPSDIPMQEARLTVLQFEDNPSNVRLIERAFRKRPGLKLLTASTGREGLRMIEETSAPDLILLDVNLPDMSGMDILVRLRANPPTRETPVVVLSADATPEQIERMLALGAQRYLTKPIDMNELGGVLNSAISRAQAVGGPGVGR